MNKTKEEVSSSLGLLAKTSLIVLIGLGISKILTYIFRIVSARYFGPEDYGLFSLSLIILGWFAALSSIGLSEGLLRYISVYHAKKQDERVRALLRKSNYLLALSGILAGLIMFSIAGFLSGSVFDNDALKMFIQVFSIGVPLITISVPLLSAIRAFERVSAYSLIYNVAQNLVKVVVLVCLVSLRFGSQAISISYLAGLGILVIAAYIYAKKKLPSLFIGKIEDKNGIAWKETLSYSWPLMLYGIISTMLYWIDSFSIGYLKDATAVGWYNAAVPIAMLIGISPEIFYNLFFPMITRLYTQGRKKTIEELGKQVTKWILMINLPIFAICFSFPEIVINLLFGSQYLEASTALRILSIGVIISSLGTVSTQLVSMVGKSKILLMNIISASLLNLILNSILIPMPEVFGIENENGINGAAIATCISLAFFTMLYFVQAYKYSGIIPLRRKLLNVFISLIVPLSGLIYVREYFNPNLMGIILSVSSFCVLYLLLLYATKSIDKHDSLVISKILQKAGITYNSKSPVED